MRFFWFFFCKHDRTTFPQTPTVTTGLRTGVHNPRTTYVTCLDCGKEFEYNWQTMAMGKELKA